MVTVSKDLLIANVLAKCVFLTQCMSGFDQVVGRAVVKWT